VYIYNETRLNRTLNPVSADLERKSQCRISLLI